MPDNDGRLTEDDRRLVGEHINGKAALIGKCPTCSSRSWVLLDHLVNLPIFNLDGAMRIPPPSFPNVGLICSNCGNTQLLNAYVAGLLRHDGLVKDENSEVQSNGPV